MYQIMESIANRLIIFLLSRAQGKNRAGKLVHVIRRSIIVIAALLFINILLITNNIYYRFYTKDLETSLSKVSFLFREEDNPLNEFVKTNKDLTSKLDESRRLNLRLVRDNTILANKVLLLMEEVKDGKKEPSKK